ncbi:HNH endonuclease family protein [Palleronia sp.]|uniref:HNH endonuclease family protein n=1 Tax=Palleronia sp. TaxID=1940284 RepID=UPI0035C7CD2D
MGVSDCITTRSGTRNFYVRYHVPVTERAAVGQDEIWRSLGMADRREARRRAPAALVKIQLDVAAAVELASPRPEPTSEQVQRAAREVYRSLVEADIEERATDREAMGAFLGGEDNALRNLSYAREVREAQAKGEHHHADVDYWALHFGFHLPTGSLRYQESAQLLTLAHANAAEAAAQHDLIHDMRRFSSIYMSLEAGSKVGEISDNLEVAVNKIHRLNKPSSTYAFVMRLIFEVKAGNIQHDVAIDILGRLESFLFRRAICGIEPTGLHAVFKGMWRELTSSRGGAGYPAVTAGNFEAHIRGKPTISWPRDSEFESALRAGNLYDRKVVKYALAELEIAVQGETPQDDFHIEHILPQKPTDEWIEVFGPDWESVVHTWANLLPLTETMNPQVSRAGYAQKREAFGGSIFSTTRNFAEEFAEWNPTALQARANGIVEFALSRWP